MNDQQWEVVWSGATWRDVPRPEYLPAPEPFVWTTRAERRRKSQAGASRKRSVATELVYACVDTCYASVNAVMDRTGLSDRTVRRILMQGVETGAVERVNQGRVSYTGGYPTYLYRRASRTVAA